MVQTETLKEYAERLKLYGLRENAEKVIHEAQINTPTYLEFLTGILGQEVERRQKNELERRVKQAKLLKNSNLDNFDFKYSCGITRPQMKQLRELIWMEQCYNIILMGPSGTGKSFIASGLVADAVQKGYKGFFITMEDLVDILRTKDMISSSLSAYNRLLKAHLIAIDDVMMFPLKPEEATSFFNLINHLHEQCSLIITTNKSPREWAGNANDEVLVTALLDRLLYHCQVIKLEGNSYRMENRREIFSE